MASTNSSRFNPVVTLFKQKKTILKFTSFYVILPTLKSKKEITEEKMRNYNSF